MIAARLHPVVAVLEDNLLGFPVMHGRQEGAGTAVMARDEMEHQLGSWAVRRTASFEVTRAREAVSCR